MTVWSERGKWETGEKRKKNPYEGINRGRVKTRGKRGNGKRRRARKHNLRTILEQLIEIELRRCFGVLTAKRNPKIIIVIIATKVIKPRLYTEFCVPKHPGNLAFLPS